ncbi:protein-glutamate methylesterase/protein-glutamine glutaminase [Geminisphaera colitermitum]|uniref:protein-glutamate methylesterase/protein-glutamine glutaminase n=1 Tax=Geminisphaera colitermitum TaxID=1148786 RepID=UPI000158CD78|nr:chemotaxis response regulator protein-glutamate methylesterase [Geminisphaera colitermitum]
MTSLIKPPAIRVLIVDDSAVVRRIVSDTLASDPAIEVVGTAMDPYIARDKILRLNPHVLTLDLEMPRMDGLTFLRILMAEHPLPVVIMSSLTQHGSQQALDALRLGAVDVIGKPDDSGTVGELGSQLIAKIKAAAIARLRKSDLLRHHLAPGESMFGGGARLIGAAAFSANPPPDGAKDARTGGAHGRASDGGLTEKAPAPADLPLLPPPVYADGRLSPRRLIVLGASTGGTEALRAVLTRLPAGLPPIAIVQHIPATFSRAFADRLNKLCAFEVREAADGDALTPGVALIAPGNYHMLVEWHGGGGSRILLPTTTSVATPGYRVRIVDGPRVWHQRPAVDLLFKSAAEHAGRHAIAGVLTGMGKDGADGLLRLRQMGAVTFAQDEASCVVYGMPRVAWENGAAQRQVALDAVPEYLLHAATDAVPR